MCCHCDCPMPSSRHRLLPAPAVSRQPSEVPNLCRCPGTTGSSECPAAKGADTQPIHDVKVINSKGNTLLYNTLFDTDRVSELKICFLIHFSTDWYP